MNADRIEFITAMRAIQFPSGWYAANSPDHFWFEWRVRVARMVIDHIALPTSRPLNVLDVGCGTGITSRQLAHQTRWTFDGTDLNIDALQQCEMGDGRILYYDILEERRDFAARYDVAILFDTLEHIEQTQPFLKAVFFHLKPGGVLLVNVPALMGLFSVYDEAAKHYRRYTTASLAREFSALDTDILDLRYWGLTMVPLLWLRQRTLRRQMSDSEIIKAGFVPPHWSAHRLLKMTMMAETALVKRPPLGTSVMAAVARKTGRAWACSD